jgi:hypothetical protein
MTLHTFRLYFFLLLIVVAGCKKEPVQQAPARTYTALTQKLVDSSGLISTVFSDTTFQVYPGVEETDLHFLGMHGLTMRAFILKVDLKNAGLKLHPLTPYGSKGFAMQSVPEMIKWVDAPGRRVQAAVNSDFFDVNTGIPRGAVVLNGELVKTVINDTWSYFGVNKTGALTMGSKEEFPLHKDELLHALGGRHRLVKEGKAQPQTDPNVEPRTAVGYTNDKVLYFMVVDGRRFDYSNGITIEGLGKLMKALGVQEALNLDGGGSSTFVIRHPLADVWQVRNRTSDGAPRAVANGWAVVANIP